jgi:hypothetical protein
VSDEHPCRRGVHLVGGFVQRRTVEPDDMFFGVVEFSVIVTVVRRSDVLMRREVTVRDGVLVVVSRPRFVDVLGRQRAHENQKRRGDQQGRGAGHRTNHRCIIQASAPGGQRSSGQQAV